MDPQQIRELIELISRSEFAEFELQEKDFSLKLVKQPPTPPPVVVAAPAAAPLPASASHVATEGALAAPPAAEPAAEAPGPPPGTHEVRSPIVGTFYRASGPDAPPFVEVGSKVSKGQVLCIVEAMKVMNEIESEIDAEVVDVLVANGQPVEYGDVLFQLRPLA